MSIGRWGAGTMDDYRLKLSENNADPCRFSDSSVARRIELLELELPALPTGSIGKKTVGGKIYLYHRWSENGKRKEKYLPPKEAVQLREQLQRRKELQRELKWLKEWPGSSGLSRVREDPAAYGATSDENMQHSTYESSSVAANRRARDVQNDSEIQPGWNYSMALQGQLHVNVRIGDSLRRFAAPVHEYRKRDCYRELHSYIYDKGTDKVFILYGLRRTGKTTMIRQLLAGMDEKMLAEAVFVQITSGNTLAEVNQDLKLLEGMGYRYIFLDEVTLMEDFIEGAALFSDIFAASGMKIVLTGTDSLGFLFTEDEQLYDRCIMLHTTFIPYREFERVLGVCDIDEYIRYGGTMSLGGVHYNETSTFATKGRADEYVDTAIARNIQHSLRCYQYGGHFRNLSELYEQNELTSAINRVVEDINHEFTVEVLTRDFKSNDLGISASNLRRDRENPTDILDRIDLKSVTENLRRLLEIRNKEEQEVHPKATHAAEIQEYLQLLDLVEEIDVLRLPEVGRRGERTVFIQPGLRYAQAQALLESLLLDDVFDKLPLQERRAVQERILSEIRGRMLEDIVLLETKLANPKKQVFVLQFAVGEFDMVVFDPAAGSCEIYEIKHSNAVATQQYRHLLDPEKCAMTEHRYGPITEKYVLYRGITQTVDGIRYQNVEEYLRELEPSETMQY